MNLRHNKKIESTSFFKTADVTRFRRVLLRWYDLHKRDLPWRGEKDPYKIWVSEIMLQQTRVAVVLDRYSRFLKRFPTVRALAAARVSSVLAEWSGLGYYRRARALHTAAGIVAREHGGRLPQSAAALAHLPGIGRYTAAAVASIAFGEAVPLVDGNVERVLQRVYGPSLVRTQKDCWRHAGQLLHTERPGDFNQALMELGATICLPAAPLCSRCPLAQLCRGRKQFSSPPRVQRTNAAEERRKVQASYRVLLHDNHVYLVQRSPNATLMPAMWELPPVGDKRVSLAQCVRLRHSITNTDFEVFAYLEKRGRASEIKSGLATWVRVDRLNRLPLTGLARKILRSFSLLD